MGQLTRAVILKTYRRACVYASIEYFTSEEEIQLSQQFIAILLKKTATRCRISLFLRTSSVVSLIRGSYHFCSNPCWYLQVIILSTYHLWLSSPFSITSLQTIPQSPHSRTLSPTLITQRSRVPRKLPDMLLVYWLTMYEYAYATQSYPWWRSPTAERRMTTRRCEWWRRGHESTQSPSTWAADARLSVYNTGLLCTRLELAQSRTLSPPCCSPTTRCERLGRGAQRCVEIDIPSTIKLYTENNLLSLQGGPKIGTIFVRLNFTKC